MEIKKSFIYFKNAFSLFLVEHMDRIKIAANLTGTAIKAGFKFAYAYPFERDKRDEAYKEFCSTLQKNLEKGIK
jgi:hypothetical protein